MLTIGWEFTPWGARTMNKLFPIHRWLVVDDNKSDVEDLALAIEGLGGKFDSADNIKAAEKLLKKNIYDVCVIDCFYKGSNKTGLDLLPELRNTLPGLPVVMISSTDDIELPSKVIMGGADIFCPKLKDSLSMTKILGAAALQAVAFRKLKVLEHISSTHGELYLSPLCFESMENSLRRKEERLLISGASGTGKTQCAQTFANKFIKQNYGIVSRNVVYHSCLSRSDEENSHLLFGSKENTGSHIDFNLFERAVGGVLILDDIHALSLENQKRLKTIFDSEQNYKEGNAPIHYIKCVFTCSTEKDVQIIPGLIESFAHRELDLPALQDLGPDLHKAVEFVIHQYIKINQDVRVSFHLDSITKILDIVCVHTLPANFKTLYQLIDNSFHNAMSDRRTLIYPNDIELTCSIKAAPNMSSLTAKSNYDFLDNRYGETLLRNMAVGENFDEAKEMLRKIMVQTATKKHGGNKSKVAAALGISRQSLYDHEDV